MRGKVLFLSGMAVGFVLGSRAGRRTYDELVAFVSKVKASPGVQEASGVVQAQAAKLYERGKDTVSERLGQTRLGERFMAARGQGDPADHGADHLSTNSR
jgi:hypothetical protein